jgi:hypothetical protein
MGLSHTQLQQIADGYAVFSRLLEPVLQGMRQLQLQQQPGDSSAAAADADGNSSVNRNLADGANSSAPVACGADKSDASSPTSAAAAAAAYRSAAMLSAESYKMHRCERLC